MEEKPSVLTKKIYWGLVWLCIPVLLLVLLPAGTIRFWQGWVWCAIFLGWSAFVLVYFVKKNSGLIERRMQTKEKETVQKYIMKALWVLFIGGLVFSGLDRRFGWSNVPLYFVIISDIMVFLGYLMIFLVMKTNSFAATTIRVEAGQKVISTGPYAVVRHPMYAGAIIMCLFSAVAMGSYWALIPFGLGSALVVLRLLNEEKVLINELEGYGEYCRKTRYRLIPFIW
jgi:protein-S-isoprenylcysteine O-methyltransferase Ste14